MTTMKYVKYVCAQCNAEDVDKLFENEVAAPAINCWSCHAGQNRNIAEMIHGRMGMFPVVQEEGMAT